LSYQKCSRATQQLLQLAHCSKLRLRSALHNAQPAKQNTPLKINMGDAKLNSWVEFVSLRCDAFIIKCAKK
jgi:hypothetical protein